jgi:hypothetical protein
VSFQQARVTPVGSPAASLGAFAACRPRPAAPLSPLFLSRRTPGHRRDSGQVLSRPRQASLVLRAALAEGAEWTALENWARSQGLSYSGWKVHLTLAIASDTSYHTRQPSRNRLRRPSACTCILMRPFFPAPCPPNTDGCVSRCVRARARACACDTSETTGMRRFFWGACLITI